MSYPNCSFLTAVCIDEPEWSLHWLPLVVVLWLVQNETHGCPSSPALCSTRCCPCWDAGRVLGDDFWKQPCPAHPAEQRTAGTVQVAATCLPAGCQSWHHCAFALKPDFRFVFPIVAFLKRHLIRADLPFVLERDSQVEENFVWAWLCQIYLSPFGFCISFLRSSLPLLSQVLQSNWLLLEEQQPWI